jgi:speckle-type POZ protein
MCRRLKVFPKGESDEKGKSLTVFLELLNCERFPSNRTLYAKFKLRILDQLHNKYYEKTGEDNIIYQSFLSYLFCVLT